MPRSLDEPHVRGPTPQVNGRPVLPDSANRCTILLIQPVLQPELTDVVLQWQQIVVATGSVTTAVDAGAGGLLRVIPAINKSKNRNNRHGEGSIS